MLKAGDCLPAVCNYSTAPELKEARRVGEGRQLHYRRAQHGLNYGKGS